MQLNHDFAGIYTEYGKKIYRLLYRLTQDSHVAEDLTQETFIAAFREIATFRGESTFKTWIYAIAVNRHRDLLRRKARIFDYSEGAEIDPSCPRQNPHELLERRETIVRVREALRAVPEKLRAPLLLVRFEGMTYRETGEILGISVETVRMRVHHAHLLLAKVLKKYY